MAHALPNRVLPGRAFKGTRLIPYILRQWPSLAAIILFSILNSVISAAQPWPMKILVDYGLMGSAVPESVRAVLESLNWTPTAGVLVVAASMMSLAIFVLRSGLQVGLVWAWSLAGQRMVYDLTADLFNRLQRISLSEHNRRPIGDSLSRLSFDTWSVYSLTSGLLTPGQHVLTLVTTAAVAWRLDRQLAVLSLAMAPLLAVSSFYFGRKLKRRARLGREAQSRLLSFVQQTLGAIPLVQAFSREELNRERFHTLSNESVALSQQGAVLNRTYGLVNGFVITMGSAIVLYVGGERVLTGTLTLGSLLVFLTYTRSMERAAEGVLKTYSNLKPVEASLDRVLEIFEGDNHVPESPRPKPFPAPSRGCGAHLRFKDVTFGHEPGRPVLKNINLEVNPGETLALVGRTGVGKSTLASMIPRFVDPWEGHVAFNRVDVRDVSLRLLRENVAIVLQEPYLLPRTVAENIAYGRPDASREEVIAAAVAASADEFIRQLPSGYDTVLGQKGLTLSGGQRQRLSLARAFLKDAPVLILDEPTSALDADTERSLMEALERLAKDRTTLIIAHRLSTVMKADRVAVLHEGTVAEYGSPAELLESNGIFQRLHDLQFLGAAPREAAS